MVYFWILFSLSGIAYTVYFGVLNFIDTPSVVKLISFEKEVERGTALDIEWEISRKWKNCKVEVSRYIRSMETNEEYSLGTYDVYPSNISTYNLKLKLPISENIPSGKYEYYSKSYFSCNALHRLFGPKEVTIGPLNVTILDNTNQLKSQQRRTYRRQPEEPFSRIIKQIFPFTK
jgi:hypothetical protein